MSLEIAPFGRTRTSFYWRFIVTMALSSIISEILVENFSYPPCIRTPRGYPKVKTLRICLAVLTQYRRVTDGLKNGQTDGRTDILRQHSPRYA